MTRVPKFRAWLKEEKEMVDLIGFLEFPLVGGGFRLYTATKDPIINKDDIIFMQYTGFKDEPVGSEWSSEENHEICEGDILQWEYSDGPELNQTGYVRVYWEKGAFRVKGKDVSDFTLDDFIDGVDWCEVVGNIYENPELLG